MYLLRRQINKYIALVILLATLSQSGLIQSNVSGFKNENKFDFQTTLSEASNSFYSPCNLENSLKKVERASQKESTDFKIFKSTDFFYTDETVRRIQLKFFYSIKIFDKIKINQLALNHIDLRSPPTFLS